MPARATRMKHTSGLPTVCLWCRTAGGSTYRAPRTQPDATSPQQMRRVLNHSQQPKQQTTHQDMNPCPVCALLLRASASSVHQQQKFDPAVAAAVLAEQLHQCKQKLQDKRQLISQLQQSNSELVAQLVELKFANAALSSKVAAITATENSLQKGAAVDTLRQENHTLRQSLAQLQLQQHALHQLHVHSTTSGSGAQRNESDGAYSGFGGRAQAESQNARLQEQAMFTSPSPTRLGQRTTSATGQPRQSLLSSCCTGLELNGETCSASNSGGTTQQDSYCGVAACTTAAGGMPAAVANKSTPLHTSSPGRPSLTDLAVRADPASPNMDPAPPVEVLDSMQDVVAAAQQFTQQVLQDLGNDLAHQHTGGLVLQCEDSTQEQQQQISSVGLYESSELSTADASTCSDSVNATSLHRPKHTRQQQYSILRTGGGYMPGSNQLTPANELLNTAAVYTHLKAANRGQQLPSKNGVGKKKSSPRRQPWTDSTVLRTSSFDALGSGKSNAQSQRPETVSAAIQTLMGSSRSAAVDGADSISSASWLPSSAVSIMQDFCRQHCCVEWPLVEAARSCSRNGSPAKANRAGLSPAAAAGAAGQPLVPWQVLARLLLLLDKAFRDREHMRLSAQKARHVKQLSGMKRRVVGAKTLPLVIQQNKVHHLQSQLDTARQTLAKRDFKQHAAVVKAAEHGYHIGRQLDIMTAEAQELRDQLSVVAEQRIALIEKVAEGFISGAHWKATQVATFLEQLDTVIYEAEALLTAAAAAAQDDECYCEELCHGVVRIARVQQQALRSIADVVATAWSVVGG